jgi:hypothetical protein
MKKAILSLIVMIIVNLKPFCAGLGEYLAYDYYTYINGKATEIILDRYSRNEDNSVHKDSYKQTYAYLKDGLVIIQTEDEGYYKKRFICYNEYYNDNIESNIKLNENIQLDFQFLGESVSFEDDPMGIVYRGNEIEITAIRRGAYLVETKQILFFDHVTKRLKSIRMTYTDSNGAVLERRNHEYKYDDSGRLTNILYEYTDRNDVVNITYYYDGIRRFSPKTWFSGVIFPKRREIVIYDGNALKHRIVTRAPSGRSITSGYAYYVQFSYDNYANEIYQEGHRKDGTVTAYETELVELDDKRNWTHARRYENDELIAEYYRNIFQIRGGLNEKEEGFIIGMYHSFLRQDGMGPAVVAAPVS